MAKTTKALSGPAKRKYFRDALATDPGVTDDATDRLTEKFDDELSNMRVRSHVSLRMVSPAHAAKAQPTVEAQPQPPVAPADQTPTAPTAAQPRAPTFNPHAFSLIVVMTRQGADGLRKTLDAIDDPDDLRALARAQHVAIDGSLAAASELRSAIIAGTAQRIADRRAAAS